MSLAEKIIYESEKRIIEAIKSGQYNLEERDEFGFRPLIEAVICKKRKVLETLLEYGADIEQQDILGRTALQWATERGFYEYCEFLLENNADPNHASEDGQPILVYPILREQLEFIKLFQKYGADPQFAEDFISAKLIGHRFELTGDTDIVSPKGIFIPLSYEGFYLEFTCDLIRRSLYNYVNSITGQKYAYFTDDLDQCLDSLNRASVLMDFSKQKDKSPFKQEIQKNLNHELLIIPVGHAGHAITFIKYKDLLAKCDRGVGNIADTVVIYRVTNKSQLNIDFYNKLIYEPKTDYFMKYEIKELLGLKFIQKLPTKSQISGNCSWANVEASVPASLFMLNYVHHENSKLPAANLKKKINGFYNSWVEWDKDSSLDEAMISFDNADLSRKFSKAMILTAILVQRLSVKYKHDIVRARKILVRLVEPNYQFILFNIRSLYIKHFAGKTGKNVLDLLKACGLDLNTYTIKNLPSKNTDKNPKLIKMTTALHVACLTNELNVVKQLLEKSHIDVNYLDRTGSTALMYASWIGNLKIVKYLVEKKRADTSIINYKGGTALRYAKYAGHKEIIKLLEKYSKI